MRCRFALLHMHHGPDMYSYDANVTSAAPGDTFSIVQSCTKQQKLIPRAQRKEQAFMFLSINCLFGRRFAVTQTPRSERCSLTRITPVLRKCWIRMNSFTPSCVTNCTARERIV